jgi:hypothetical protein
MIVTTHEKSYNTADGSEQPNKSINAQCPVASDSSASRWDDDGGNAERLSPSPNALKKPAWSVRSLRALLDAILRTKSPRAVRIRKNAVALNQTRRHDDLVESEMNEADFARRDRYRNAWEHT